METERIVGENDHHNRVLLNEDLNDPDDVGARPYDEALLLTRPRVEKRFRSGEEKRKEKGGPKFHIPNTLLIVCGHEGAGKTRVTNTLEESLDIGVIEKDPISNKFSTGRSDRNDPVHRGMRPIVYAIMYQLAAEHLQSGKSVILDAPFNKFEDFFHNQEWIALTRTLASRSGAEIKILWCEASPEVKLQRIRNRKAAQDQTRTEADLQKLASRTERPHFPFKSLAFNTQNPDEAELWNLLEAVPVSFPKNTVRGA